MDDSKQPVAIRVARPYATEDEFLEHELDTLTRTSVVLLGAQTRPQGVVLRFEVTLASGAPLLRGEGRVVAYKPHAHGGEPGLTLRFTRLDPRSKALVDRAASLRDARARANRSSQASIPSALLPPPAPSSEAVDVEPAAPVPVGSPSTVPKARESRPLPQPPAKRNSSLTPPAQRERSAAGFLSEPPSGTITMSYDQQTLARLQADGRRPPSLEPPPRPAEIEPENSTSAPPPSAPGTPDWSITATDGRAPTTGSAPPEQLPLPPPAEPSTYDIDIEEQAPESDRAYNMESLTPVAIRPPIALRPATSPPPPPPRAASSLPPAAIAAPSVPAPVAPPSAPPAPAKVPAPQSEAPAARAPSITVGAVPVAEPQAAAGVAAPAARGDLLDRLRSRARGLPAERVEAILTKRAARTS